MIIRNRLFGRKPRNIIYGFGEQPLMFMHIEEELMSLKQHHCWKDLLMCQRDLMSDSEHIILRPDEKVSDKNGYLQKQAVGSYDRFRWKDGLICLDDVPFGDLMKRFAVYYNADYYS